MIERWASQHGMLFIVTRRAGAIRQIKVIDCWDHLNTLSMSERQWLGMKIELQLTPVQGSH